MTLKQCFVPINPVVCSSANNLDLCQHLQRSDIICNQFPISHIRRCIPLLVPREAFSLPLWRFPRQHHASPPLAHRIHFPSPVHQWFI